MRLVSKAFLLASLSCVACMFADANARAQSITNNVHSIALKNGESTEYGDVYWISHNCKSMLKAATDVEILDGPPGVTATIKPAKVVPRTYSCANPVSGGKLFIAAKDVDDFSHTRMVLRFTYHTSMGDRQRTANINVTLYP
jgi:hypothetical protein